MLYVHFTHCTTVHTCVHMYIQMVVEVCVATICDSSRSTSKCFLNMMYCKCYLGTSPYKTRMSTFQLRLSILPGVHNGMCSPPSLATCWHTCGHSWRGSHGSRCRCGVGAARQCHHASGRNCFPHSLNLALLPVPFLSAVHICMDTHTCYLLVKQLPKGNVLIPFSISSTFLV